jgi:hypothetical protein
MHPRFRPAIFSVASDSTAGLSRWMHRVGVTRRECDQDTPTRNAIGLGSPVAAGPTVSMGEPNPWRSNLPPQGGGEPKGGST